MNPFPILTSLPGFFRIRIADWHHFVILRASCNLLKYKPHAIFVILHKIFIILILLFILFNLGRHEFYLHIFGNIGNNIFTISICFFTVFELA